MKNNLFIAIIIIMFCSCGESKQDNVSASAKETAQQPDTLVYTYTAVAKTEVNPNIKDTNDLYRASITYPVITGGSTLADSINKILAGTYNNASSAQAFADSFTARSKDAMDEASFNAWFYDAVTTVINNNAKFLVLQADISSYTGGAHGSYATIYYNLTRDGKQLTWDDIIEPGKKDSLVLLNETALRTQQEMPAGQNWADAGFFADSSHMPLSSVFALTKDGLNITYNQYEIAPYAMGIISYTIPYNKLNGIIKKECLP